jgi:hypothetical protein
MHVNLALNISQVSPSIAQNISLRKQKPHNEVFFLYFLLLSTVGMILLSYLQQPENMKICNSDIDLVRPPWIGSGNKIECK